ncbi:MAG: ferrous iron transport protein A [Lachnospiraceae bacterium]|nr:ferrous iron transport protein A [Lachnospiraceae bacterium]
MPLTMAKIGEELQVKRVSGSDEERRFLTNLGFTEGAPVVVLSTDGGNLIVKIRDARVALGKDVAKKIKV